MPKGKISVKLEGAKELEREFRRLLKEKPQEVKGEVYASGLDIQRGAKQELKSMKAWDLGNLANSIMVDLEDQGFTAKVEAQAPYGPSVEYGTKKHFPPPDALEGWARRHGFDSAWPICMVIAKRGLKARPFLVPAFLKVRDAFFKRIVERFK